MRLIKRERERERERGKERERERMKNGRKITKMEKRIGKCESKNRGRKVTNK